MVIDYLKAQPSLAGVPILADLVGHEVNTPAVHVMLGSGGRVVRDKMDRWNMSIKYYGPDKQATFALARKVRRIMLENLPAVRISGAVISDVQEGHAPSDFSDQVTGEQIFLHLVSLFVYT